MVVISCSGLVLCKNPRMKHGAKARRTRYTPVMAGIWHKEPHMQKLEKAGVSFEEAVAHVDVVSDGVNFAVQEASKEVADVKKEVLATKEILQEFRVERVTAKAELESSLADVRMETVQQIGKLRQEALWWGVAIVILSKLLAGLAMVARPIR